MPQEIHEDRLSFEWSKEWILCFRFPWALCKTNTTTFPLTHIITDLRVQYKTKELSSSSEGYCFYSRHQSWISSKQANQCQRLSNIVPMWIENEFQRIHRTSKKRLWVISNYIDSHLCLIPRSIVHKVLHHDLRLYAYKVQLLHMSYILRIITWWGKCQHIL